jgi:2-oxo-4-hydroxy-4-carboxy-5-ureidoimidazoline decarboxylase
MNGVLARWNRLLPDQAAEEILGCCGSRAWADGMAGRRPVLHEATLLAVSDEVWNGLSESDWLEAFHSHPRIGESQRLAHIPSRSASWSREEQVQIAGTDEYVKLALAEANRVYEQRFNRTFIVCATGKSAPEILEILSTRLQNDEKTELHEAAEQQRQITRIRVKKWLCL